MTIPARFSLTWFRGLRGEDLNVKVYGVRRTDGHNVFIYHTQLLCSKKKAREPVAHAITSAHVTSGDVISCQGRFR